VIVVRKNPGVFNLQISRLRNRYDFPGFSMFLYDFL
jgi:hypothetical protein